MPSNILGFPCSKPLNYPHCLLTDEESGAQRDVDNTGQPGEICATVFPNIVSRLEWSPTHTYSGACPTCARSSNTHTPSHNHIPSHYPHTPVGVCAYVHIPYSYKQPSPLQPPIGGLAYFYMLSAPKGESASHPAAKLGQLSHSSEKDVDHLG